MIPPMPTSASSGYSTSHQQSPGLEGDGGQRGIWAQNLGRDGGCSGLLTLERTPPPVRDQGWGKKVTSKCGPLMLHLSLQPPVREGENEGNHPSGPWFIHTPSCSGNSSSACSDRYTSSPGKWDCAPPPREPRASPAHLSLAAAGRTALTYCVPGNVLREKPFLEKRRGFPEGPRGGL